MSVWTAQELRTLSRLRSVFLAGTAGASDYWTGEFELDLYERTFAQRIGWKWDAVLRELELRGWVPPVRRLIDWGCGTGIASRKVLSQWQGQFEEVVLCDRSSSACGYARERLRAEHCEVGVRVCNPREVETEGAVVLLSHVLSELNAAALGQLLGMLRNAAGMIWVESATHANSRRLISEVREPLLRCGWNSAAPCTHSRACPLMSAENERHWCHHFARVPSAVHQDPQWRELSQRLNLDLRVLPYSFVALDRGTPGETAGHSKKEEEFRVLGVPREFKGHLKVLACNADGLTDWTLQKRDAPELYKEIRSAETLPMYRWKTAGQKIIGV